MTLRPFAALVLAVGCLRGAPAAAPAPLPAERFFQPVAFADPQISPDGRRLAARTLHDHERYALTMIDLATGKGEVLIKHPKLSVTSFGWKDNDLLLVAILGENGHHVLSAIDLRAQKVNPLDRLNRERTGPIASYLPADPAHIICPWADGSLRRVEVRTGKSVQIERAVPGINRWIFDATGTPWAGLGYLGEKWIFIWRNAPGAPWQRREQPGKNIPAIVPMALMPDHKRLVVIDRAPGQPDRLAAFDLTTAALEVMFQPERADVTAMRLWGPEGVPAVAIYTTDRDRFHAFLPEAAECYKLLAEALPDGAAYPMSFSADMQRMIVQTHSDRDAGTYYLLDRKLGRLGVIGAALPSRPASALGATQTVEAKTRDGLALTGRLTSPSGASKPPLLVMVGPGIVGPRVDAAYDATAQFLASRGYAAARFYVRGTAGLGLDFQRAGDLKITSGVIDDLEDGIAALAAAGKIDPQRVGLLGVDDGGIVAFHAALRPGFKVLLNFNTPMVTRNRTLESLAPSDRDEAELTRMLGGSAAAVAYVKSIDPLRVAATLRIPSFHTYPRGPAGYEMTESGRVLKSALARHEVPVAFHLTPLVKPETDEAKLTGERFEAAVAFLRQHL